jgi:hypothetical protein
MQIIPQLKAEVFKLSQHLSDFTVTINQDYAELFQRAVESMRRFHRNRLVRRGQAKESQLQKRKCIDFGHY